MVSNGQWEDVEEARTITNGICVRPYVPKVRKCLTKAAFNLFSELRIAGNDRRMGLVKRRKCWKIRNWQLLRPNGLFWVKKRNQKITLALILATTGAKKATASARWTIQILKKWTRSWIMLRRSFWATSCDSNPASIRPCAPETTTFPTALRRRTLLLCKNTIFFFQLSIKKCSRNSNLFYFWKY